MANRQRNLYTGSQRKLAIAIDVGTTFSGVSYAFLNPGKEPQIQPVTKFPGQKDSRADSKVPSVVCYNKDGNVVAVGAETDPETNPALEEMDGLVRAEWFKLHLRPPHLLPSQEFELQKRRSFPKNKTPIQVLGDLLRYLFQSTKQFVKDSEIMWSWDSVEDNIYFVLSHPNGWEGKQQSLMRKSAIAAGLVDESEALERITFVTEGEASLHFCLNKNPNLFNAMNDMIVVDCGGGTIDVSSYTGSSDGGFEETTTPECLFQGSVFVTLRAQKYFKEKLGDSKYGSDNDVRAMANTFDKVTKIIFNGPNCPYFVKFGGIRDTSIDPRHEIRNGKIKVPGDNVAGFFQPAIESIIQVIERQRGESAAAKAVFLAGGFARSEYLFSRLTEYFDHHGVNVHRVDTTHLNKAVADGAVSYYLDHHVSARVARHSYGIRVHESFDPTDVEHVLRQDTKFTRADGTLCIPGIFSTVLKGTVVSEETEFRQSYREFLTPQELQSIFSDLTHLQSYRGQAVVPPKWVDTEPNSFNRACTMRADLRGLKSSLKPKKSGDKTYYTLSLDVVMLFGRTELKAFVSWEENGIEKRSQAFIVYDDELTEV